MRATRLEGKRGSGTLRVPFAETPATSVPSLPGYAQMELFPAWSHTPGTIGMIGSTGTTGTVHAVVAHGPQEALGSPGWIGKHGLAQVTMLLPVTRIVLSTVPGNRRPRGGRASSPSLRFPSDLPVDLHRSLLCRRWTKLEGLTGPITMH
jgi:hypothetical protein